MPKLSNVVPDYLSYQGATFQKCQAKQNGSSQRDYADAYWILLILHHRLVAISRTEVDSRLFYRVYDSFEHLVQFESDR